MKNDLWNYISKTDKDIYIYGTGNGADLIIDKLATKGVTVSGIFSSDNFARGQYFRGYKVLKYSDVVDNLKNIIILTAFGTQIPEVIENIKFLSNNFEVYSPDAPVFGKTFFDLNFYNNNKTEIEYIKSKFADEESVFFFDKIIDFKLTGNLNSLFLAESLEDAQLKKIIDLKSNDKIFDLGAYTGDTAEKFIKLFGENLQIIAVEPDKKNFQKLLNNTNTFNNITPVNAAISYLNGTLFFGGEGGRNQSAHNGSQVVPSITVDTLIEQFGIPDFIKYDIEGEELNGLIGAENTIKNYKPKLMISAYHRSEDIISIPKKVLSLRSDYKMYIRHFPYIPCWDTYYLFI